MTKHLIEINKKPKLVEKKYLDRINNFNKQIKLNHCNKINKKKISNFSKLVNIIKDFFKNNIIFLLVIFMVICILYIRYKIVKNNREAKKQNFYNN